MDQHFSSVQPGPGYYTDKSSEPALIIVIDDEVPLVKLLVAMLEDEGYEVQVAYDGLNGLNLIKRLRPHLIISDVMLPVMSGLEVIN